MSFWKLWDKLGIYAIFAAVLVAFGIIAPNMFTATNINNMLVSASMVAIPAAGMMLCITTGNLDLSVGSNMTMATVMVAIASLYMKLDFVWIILIASVVGLAIGFLNGIIITKLRLQAFIVTLATQVIIKGIAYYLSDGKFIYFTEYPAVRLITQTRILSISFPVWLMVIVFLILYVMYRKMKFGIFVRSVGSNLQSAKLSGIKTDKVLISVFAFTGLMATIAGIIAVAQTLDGNVRYGGTLAIDCITAVVLGGTILSGGKGNVFGTLVASILLAIIKSGLNQLGLNDYYQNLVTGLILISVLMIEGFKLKSLKLTKDMYS